ncbi:MAG: hypothetical protein QM767_27150 [Anaeromyxobacter sp.]
MRTLLTCLLAGLLLPAAALAADVVPPPLGIPELNGPRSLALSASVGLAGGLESLASNPGALAARRRYVGSALYLSDLRPTPTGGEDPDGQYFGGGVLDSVSTPMAVGVNYLRAQQGIYEGNIYAMGFALPMANQLYVGVGGRYLQLDGPEKIRNWTADAGAFWQVTQHVTLGGAAYNVLSTYHDATTPRGYGAGLTVGSEQFIQLTGDWRSQELDDGTHNQLGGGLELLLGNAYVFRGGYRHDDVGPAPTQQFWSAGVGFVTQAFALDAGYRQSLDVSAAKTFTVQLRGFLPNE